MKQPPPPYCQVAMTTPPNPIVPNALVSNANDQNQTIIMPCVVIQAIPSTCCDDVRNKIPPAYEENAANRAQSNTTLSSLDNNRPLAANDTNVPPTAERQPNH